MGALGLEPHQPDQAGVGQAVIAVGLDSRDIGPTHEHDLHWVVPHKLRPLLVVGVREHPVDNNVQICKGSKACSEHANSSKLTSSLSAACCMHAYSGWLCVRVSEK